ncbi:metallophosphoesterase [Oxynema sp. CENA135]|uniref:metallophosphoesterase n=1 Tax=Oxynema sp. CENA135 TaxID=984206 RepID=UPI001909AA34|nr:metallophosphoesterase [Oxynema sp. CENA135]MBK4732604.1 metallophosphoesterase [Oxynema sp. CENA135]
MHRVLTGPLRLEKTTVAIADLPEHLHGIKIVQLSDFHYEGWGLSEQLLQEAIATSNLEDPDLVVLTGDYVTQDPAPIRQLVDRLKTLKHRAGIYAVLGNHDIKPPETQVKIIQALTHAGIRVLWNEVAYPFGNGLALVGMADLYSGEFKPAPVLMPIAPKTPRIVLSHNPATAEILRKWRVDLQLSGHTHGGQIVLPIVGPIPTKLKAIRSWVPQLLRPWLPWMQDCYKVYNHWHWCEGFYQVGTNALYVNRGLGTYFPGRFFCPPEVTAIVLESGVSE